MPTICDPHWSMLPTSSSVFHYICLPIAPQVEVLFSQVTSTLGLRFLIALHHLPSGSTFCFKFKSVLNSSTNSIKPACVTKSSNATRSAAAFTTSTPLIHAPPMDNADTRCKRRLFLWVTPAAVIAITGPDSYTKAEFSQILDTVTVHTRRHTYAENTPPTPMMASHQ
jgi:hypothetical protein